MSRARRVKRTDLNQPAIVKALRDISGVTVQLDVDDILVGYKGRTYWFEIKESPKANIQPSQIDLAENWKGHYKIVWSLDMILADMGI